MKEERKEEKKERKIPKIYYDLEWAAIIKVSEMLMSFKTDAEYSALMRSDPNYKKYINLKKRPTNWRITFDKLQKKKQKEMNNLKSVIDGKEVFPMSKNEENGCNEQTKQYLDLIGIKSKFYMSDEEDEYEEFNDDWELT